MSRATGFEGDHDSIGRDCDFPKSVVIEPPGKLLGLPQTVQPPEPTCATSRDGGDDASSPW